MVKEIRFKLQQGVEEVYPDANQSLTQGNDFLPLEVSLNKTMRVATEVQKKVDELRKSGADQEVLNESIGTTIVLIGVLSVGIVVASGLLQVFYLKSFFRRRKIL
eukprot:TRINITY_DN1593_c0_g2_i1.p2 TRINITY_DN1593_c0_g2~~TRINITY_DN1593_c0_g2_i1.p2  ORF type:complete len:105 (+),score=30.42 TRINITY_DN1593_c0_g2_i1:477-791(+)